MQSKSQPEISPNPQKLDFTCVTFWPDLSKFRMKCMDSDIVSLLTKRAYDLAGITDPKVQVKLNGKLITCKTWSQYCDLYLKNKESMAENLPKIIEKPHDRWEIICSLSDG